MMNGDPRDRGRGMPATMAMVRRAAMEREQELEAWARGLAAGAEEFPGFHGSVVAPVRRGPGESYVVVALQFDTATQLAAWEVSDVRAALLAAGEDVTDGSPEAVALDALSALGVGGLSGGGSGSPREPRWRAVLMVWAALFPPAVALNLALSGGEDAWLVIGRTMATTMLLVPVVVVVTLPLVGKVVARLVASLRRAGR